MKTLVVGDLHTKYNILDRVIQLSKDYDRVVFLGDYVDDWNTVPEASHNLLIGLKEFYENNIGKVILLLGNHDLSEWVGDNFRCSGFNPQSHLLVNGFFARFEMIFKVAHYEQGYLFTHAGVTEGWKNKYLPDCDTGAQIADKLNWAYRHWGENDEAEKIFLGLSGVGFMRNGWDVPSPVWADINELLQDPIPELNQIVGHSPVDTVRDFQSYGAKLWFCDTHSLYSDKRPIGDNSLLEIVDGEVNKIDLFSQK